VDGVAFHRRLRSTCAYATYNRMPCPSLAMYRSSAPVVGATPRRLSNTAVVAAVSTIIAGALLSPRANEASHRLAIAYPGEKKLSVIEESKRLAAWTAVDRHILPEHKVSPTF